MPRTLTNKLNLPETIVKAVSYDTHKTIPGALSVSALIDSPRIRLLKKQVEYNEDVSEMLYALMGTSIHHIIERANMPALRQRAFALTIETILGTAEEESDSAIKQGIIKGAGWLRKIYDKLFTSKSEWLTEQTLNMEVDGYLICGTFDAYHIPTKTLYDYKMCSTYAWTSESSRRKWKAQTNIYATLLEEAGYPVEKIKVVALFRDWNSSGLRSKDYPPAQLCEMPMDLNPREDEGGLKGRMSFIKMRVKLHRDAEQSDILPLCTGTDRWASADMWAIKMKGGKKALKLEDSEKKAKEWIQESRFRDTIKEFEIEFRPGISSRCEKYCPVASQCDQFKMIKEQQLKNSNNE